MYLVWFSPSENLHLLHFHFLRNVATLPASAGVDFRAHWVREWGVSSEGHQGTAVDLEFSWVTVWKILHWRKRCMPDS